MIKAPTPENEAERLARLKSMRVLDTPVEERFERITRLVCRTLGVPIAAVSLVDSDRQWFKSIQGLDVEETPRDISFCGHAIMHDEPLVVGNALEDERFHDNPLVAEAPSIRFYAGCPLVMADGTRIGTLCAIDQQPREITEDELIVLRDLAAMVQSELQAASLSEAHTGLLEELKEAERASLIDPMTRIWNRRGGEKLLKREWDSMQRKGKPMAMAMIDIDHFKKVNDTHGHDAGDKVICHVAKMLIKSLRPADILCRWGGEEFLLLFPECEPQNLQHALDRLIKAVHGAPAATPAEPLQVTVSVGAVSIEPSASGCYEDYIKLADNALYEAKGNGRNRFEISSGPEPEKQVVGF
ncbi:MAG: sensor domain-containing diguanylate cyclase [Pseudomonadales bacterium]|nr:MAG: sensor domain-containing diguanylate cyclase [Pseudomonadales bacterium]